MSWAGRRKGLYIGVSTLVFLLIAGGIGYAIFSHTPTCTDGIQNGTETGVDCGGSCALRCSEDVRVPVVLWSRSFEVAPGVYTAAAYVQNNNISSYVRKAHYTFKLFNSDNVLIAERSGIAPIPPGRISVFVEPNIATGNRIPTRTFFQFTDMTLAWEKGDAPPVTLNQQSFDVDARKVSVSVHNDSTREIQNLPIAVVLFDANDTAIAASASTIARLMKAGDETVVFTWPSDFVGTPIRAEVTALGTP